MNLLTAIVGTGAFQVFNQTTSVMALDSIKVKSVQMRFSSEPQKHQMEDGKTLIDSKVVRPAHLELEIFCKDASSLEQVNAVLSDRTSRFQITCRGVIVSDMMVSSEVMLMDKACINAHPVRLAFSQILIQNVSPIVFANVANASLIDRGVALANSAKGTVTDLYTKVSGYI